MKIYCKGVHIFSTSTACHVFHYISCAAMETTHGTCISISIEKSWPRYIVGTVKKHDVPSVFFFLTFMIIIKRREGCWLERRLCLCPNTFSFLFCLRYIGKTMQVFYGVHHFWTSLQTYAKTLHWIRVMVFNATFINILVISWWSVLLVEWKECVCVVEWMKMSANYK